MFSFDALDPVTVLLVLLLWPRKSGRTPSEQATRLAMVFPVSLDAASFSPDYHAEDSDGTRKHLGVDIFAEKGTAVFAPEAGNVRFDTDPLGGMVFYLTGCPSGHTYYGAHLMAFAGGKRRVQAGEQIGNVGDTGNAKGGPAHLHLQVDGGKTDPYPLLHALAPSAPAAPYARGQT